MQAARRLLQSLVPSMNAVSQLRVGCCGFALAQARYFDTFSCVEISTSFYQLPQPATAERWRAAAPPGFRFAMRAWQVVTIWRAVPPPPHASAAGRPRAIAVSSGSIPRSAGPGAKPTRWRRFWKPIWCCSSAPPVSGRTRTHLTGSVAFFEKAKRGRFLLGWEPRGAWPLELVATLCRELDLIHVVDPYRQQPALRQPRRYFRLHGVGGRQHQFSEDELQRLQQIVAADRTRSGACLTTRRWPPMHSDSSGWLHPTVSPPAG